MQKPVQGENIVTNNVKYEWGNINVNEFLQKLNKEGINDAKVESSGNSVMIHLVSKITSSSSSSFSTCLLLRQVLLLQGNFTRLNLICLTNLKLHLFINIAN